MAASGGTEPEGTAAAGGSASGAMTGAPGHSRASRPRPRLLERYRAFLPLTDATPIVSLGEGATPLVHAERLGAAWGSRTSTSSSRG